MNTDNIGFQAELDAASHIYNDNNGLDETGDTFMEDWPKVDADEDDDDDDDNEAPPAASARTHKVNVFDYEVDAFDEDNSQQEQEMQEMQERGKSLLHQ